MQDHPVQLKAENLVRVDQALFMFIPVLLRSLTLNHIQPCLSTFFYVHLDIFSCVDLRCTPSVNPFRQLRKRFQVYI